MAITKLWSRRSEPNHSALSIIAETIDYACNPDKTKNISIALVDEEFIENNDAIDNVLKYVVNEKKTSITGKEEYIELEKLYVTGINCNAKTADTEFMNVKEYWGKTDKTLLWHGTQSFAPGEVDPNTAHEIGIRLAEKMWGDKYQVLVTTHCDKEHIHNHFVFNSVSFINGNKYNYSKSEIYRFRSESDKLCKEYDLSVIENPKGHHIHYSEWINAKDGKTVRSLIKSDIDDAIANSSSLYEVYRYLENVLGYEINTRNKYTTVKPPGHQRAFRLVNLDNNKRNPRHINQYTEEAIVMRLRNKQQPLILNNTSYKKQHTSVKNNCFDEKDYIDMIFSSTNIRGLYWHYYYLLRNIDSVKKSYPKSHFKIRREAQQKISTYQKHIVFLSTHHFSSSEEITTYAKQIDKRIDTLQSDISDLRSKLIYCSDMPQQNKIINLIKQKNSELTQLKTERRTCDEIVKNEKHIKNTVNDMNNNQNKNNERNSDLWEQKNK